MVYNSSAYIGTRITQFILTVVTALVVGLISDKRSMPLLYYGLFPHSKLSDAQTLSRITSLSAPFFGYPILSMFISCYILCCTKRFRPHAVTIVFDALGIITYLFSGIIFVICIKENESIVKSLVNKLADKYLPDELSKTVNSLFNEFRTIANDGIDFETVTYVMEGCLVYFAIQVICCAVCIYLATVYTKNANRQELQTTLLLNQFNSSS